METIKEAAAKIGKSRQAIHRAIQEGRIRGERRGRFWYVDTEEARAVLRGRYRGKSGMPGVTWLECRKRWRVVYLGRVVAECNSIEEGAAILERAKLGELIKRKRDLPRNVYKAKTGAIFVKICEGGGVAYRKTFPSVAAAVKARDEFLGRQKNGKNI